MYISELSQVGAKSGHSESNKVAVLPLGQASDSSDKPFVFQISTLNILVTPCAWRETKGGGEIATKYMCIQNSL